MGGIGLGKGLQSADCLVVLAGLPLVEALGISVFARVTDGRCVGHSGRRTPFSRRGLGGLLRRRLPGSLALGGRRRGGLRSSFDRGGGNRRRSRHLLLERGNALVLV